MVVTSKVKSAIGLSSKTPSTTTTTTTTTTNTKSTVFNRARSSAQVQPKPPNITHLLLLIEQLRDNESRLKTQLIEQKLLLQAAAFVPSLEAELGATKYALEQTVLKLSEVQHLNDKLVRERELLHQAFQRKDLRISELSAELDELKSLSNTKKLQGLIEVSGKSKLINNLSFKKLNNTNSNSNGFSNSKLSDEINNNNNKLSSVTHSSISSSSSSSSLSLPDEVLEDIQVRVPRVPKPPPPKRECSSESAPVAAVKVTPPAPPPPPPTVAVKKAVVGPPPPPPVPVRGVGTMTGKVKRVPEVVEFYHSLMRRDTRRDNGGGTAEVTSTSAKDLVGEIENRSAYLLAIKTDVETQGEFIKFLIKEVETAAFTDIEDVVSFVKWLDDELSYLVDERAVLKHFSWPEQKADALREAAFEYSDLKKLESEASSFRDVARQACSTTLKKMQTLLEKLEHGVYNLSRLRESASSRFKSFHIPVDWMLDTGFVSQIKLASVKLAMKYMKRVSAELEAVGSGPEEEELIVQGVRFAFRVHQFAGGFDVETMRAFEELRDKARSCHVQFQNQQQTQQQSLICRSMPC